MANWCPDTPNGDQSLAAAGTAGPLRHWWRPPRLWSTSELDKHRSQKNIEGCSTEEGKAGL